MTVTETKPRIVALGSALLLFQLAACSGPEAGDFCVSNAECGDSLFCLGPNAPQACGIPPTEICASDDGCTGGQVCHAISDPCSSDGLGSQCGAPCSANNCGTGFRCNASGACEAVPCDEVNACTAFEQCDTSFFTDETPVFNRTDGCQPISCGEGAPCPSATVCVNGICQSGEGVCGESIAVP